MDRKEEAKIVGDMLVPLIEKMGMKRALAAIAESEKLIDALDGFVDRQQKLNNFQLVMDTVYVIEHWAKTIREGIPQEVTK